MSSSLHPYIYSLEPKLWLKELKSWEFDIDIYETDKIKSRMHKHDIQSHVVWEDAHFKFSKIVNKPYIMYSKGDLWLLDQKMIAIVWPRKVSPYITRVMEDFFDVLSQYDVVTVSGGAQGVDMLCHNLSYTHDIPTVMVLGQWLGHVMQTNKRHQIEEVYQKWGLVLSEFRLKQDPTNRTFPQRNRIVAGLAESIFLPWAAMKSGSLITVDFGLQMHIPIGTVPASIYEPSSAGTNAYISTHQIDAVTDFEGFLDAHYSKKAAGDLVADIATIDLTDTQRSLVDFITEHGPSSAEWLSLWLDIWISIVMWELMELEMNGILKDIWWAKYGL